MHYTCEYCKKQFSGRWNLTKHQRTARYCLELQGTNSNVPNFTCTICNKNFQRKDMYTRHFNSCSQKNLKIQQQALQQKEKELQDKERDLVDKTEPATVRIDQLQELFKAMAMIISQSPVQFPQQLQIQHAAPQQASQQAPQTMTEAQRQMVNMKEALTDANIRQHLAVLSLDIILKGGRGYADHAGGYPFKDRVVCTDRARKKLKYMDEDGVIISDAGGAKLTKRYFQVIGPRNEALINEKYNELQQQVANIADTGTTEDSNIVELLTKSIHLQTLLAESKAAAQGADNALTRDFVNHLARIL